MDFNNEFRVSLPMEPAWELFNDVERLVPCMPGAQLTDIDGEQFHGTVKVKVGPVTVQYKGVASFEKRDAANRTVRLNAAGRDTRGQGNADAHITVQLTADGDGTRVAVQTQLRITGKVAQFGKGVMEDISKKLLDQFVACLEDRLAAERKPARPEPAVPADKAPGTAGSERSHASTNHAPAPQANAPVATEAAARATPVSGPDDSEPLDLLDVARGALLKRLAPVAAGVLAALALAFWLRGHRRPGCHRRRSGHA
ncbi:carbon monoxide dehydrogenase subunit G [Streptacidiphilus sp. MAP12-16]|uniref:SRPBCC family protein n=1 Tax=Streptacidiphilus sp. MAP12-16 TaxID=3156300 RepID=UPI0035181E2A